MSEGTVMSDDSFWFATSLPDRNASCRHGGGRPGKFI